MKSPMILGWVAYLWMGLTWASVAGSVSLPRSTPESQGVSSKALLELVKTLDHSAEGMHSLMVVRHGHVVAEGWWKPYDAAHNHVLYSLSKSFTSTAVGFAVSEGRLTIDDEVTGFFPDVLPKELSGNLKAMRVRDLLTMTTGHQDEPPVTPEAVSPQSFLAQPVPHVPGTHFKYNTAATFMQSAIVQKLAGEPIVDYLKPRLFEPLGITQPVWDKSAQGINLGGYGLRVRTEDIAKLGQLYLQKGKWNGKQILPASWVEMATSKQVSNGSNPKSDWNQGYGFQFWRCRHNGFRGDGAFGQYCVVLPDQDVVVAITSGVKDMQAVLNILWEKLLPAVQPSRGMTGHRADQNALQDALAHLEIAAPKGALTSPNLKSYVGHTFVFPTNDQKLERVTLESGDAGQHLTLSLQRDGKKMSFVAGSLDWAMTRSMYPAGFLAMFPDEPVAGRFAWSSDNTCVFKVCAVETPFQATYQLRFEGDQVSVESEANVGFGPTKRPAVTGKAL